MTAALYSFIDIFNSNNNKDDEIACVKKIVVPIIQRDYAQGRSGLEVERIREKFLNSLKNAITTQTPITLDFVYGDINADGVMTPLDGQQRLTTLFLLHWYAAKKSQVNQCEYEFLKNFSYETRHSARDFCSCLISFTPTFNTKLSAEIIDQYWFPLDWEKDQTVNSMLTMLDAIDDKFSSVDGLWGKLNNGLITFFFLPIKDMGLTDELYIKLNSRGKPLTTFEHFKAELERKLKEANSPETSKIVRKIDRDWTDMLWEYRGDENLIDDKFLHYFRFIFDILCYKNGLSPQEIQIIDEFDLLEKFFSLKSTPDLNNIKFLEQMFNCWCSLGTETSEDFLLKFISREHENNKIKFDSNEVNIFKDCLFTYIDRLGNRKFPLSKIILLYAITVYLLNKKSKTDKESITESDFVRRLRVINNLIQNSSNEISESTKRSGGNTMPDILRQVDSIMLNGKIDKNIPRNFNSYQISEEIEKLEWCAANPELAQSLYKLEDHKLLYGQIAILGLDRPELFERFSSLFSCDKDLIDCALLASGNYSQVEQNRWRYQLGSKLDQSWKNLFHKNSNYIGYENTRNILTRLLDKHKEFTDEKLKDIVNTYIKGCESNNQFDWKYYYLKYKSFRPDRYGKYSTIISDNGSWDWESHPYQILALHTELAWSSNARQPFLFEIDKDHINRNVCGKTLIYDNVYVTCEDSSFKVISNEDESYYFSLDVLQKDGIDAEDRIEKAKKELPSLIEYVSKNVREKGNNQ